MLPNVVERLSTYLSYVYPDMPTTVVRFFVRIRTIIRIKALNRIVREKLAWKKFNYGQNETDIGEVNLEDQEEAVVRNVPQNCSLKNVDEDLDFVSIVDDELEVEERMDEDYAASNKVPKKYKKTEFGMFGQEFITFLQVIRKTSCSVILHGPILEISPRSDGRSIGDEDDETINDPTIYDPSQLDSGKPLAAQSSSVINFYPEWCKCFGKSSIRYPHGEDVTCSDLIRYFFQCPPHGALARIIIFFMVFGFGWAILYFLIGEAAGFKGPIIAMIILEISGLFLGLLMKTFRLPSLLAPLIIGIVLRNVEALNIFEFFKYPFNGDLINCQQHLGIVNATLLGNLTKLQKCCDSRALEAQSKWITPIREIALTMILTRAGLELSPKQLKKLKGVVPLLAFTPCIVEALVAAVLFFGIYNVLDPPFPMCLVAGFALAAVSPAVVVPGMLSLSKRGYGVVKGVPTLLIAASSIDDVLAISLFSICLSISTARTHDGSPKNEECRPLGFMAGVEIPSELEIGGGFIGIAIGLVHGVLVGCVLHFIPSRDTSSKATLRLIVLLSVNIASLLAYSKTEFLSSAGSLGVLVTSFVASFGWRSQPHWKPIIHEIEHGLATLWTLCVPILFGTIGNEMNFVPVKGDGYFTSNQKNTPAYKSLGHPFSGINIAKIFGIIFCCLLLRSLAAYFIGSFAGLNVKERIFVSLAWIPKATVQAALAPLVITTIVDKQLTDLNLRWLALNTVALAVFGILLTAPLGSIAIAFAGPRLLSKIDPSEIEEEFPNGEGSPEDEEEVIPRRRSSANSSPTPKRDSVLSVYTKPGATDDLATQSSITSTLGVASSTNDVKQGAASSTNDVKRL